MKKKLRYVVEKDNDVVLPKKIENMPVEKLKEEIAKLKAKKPKKLASAIKKPECSTTFNF